MSAETPEQRLARARAALAAAEAAATESLPAESRGGSRRRGASARRGAGGSGDGQEPAGRARRSDRGGRRTWSRSVGRPSRRPTRSENGENDAREEEIDLSSWPGAGPPPEWVPEVPTAAADDAGGTTALETEAVDASGEPDLMDEHEEEARVRQIVLRQLAMAPRSRAQLEDKLAERDVDAEVADAVLDRFTEVGLVDDAAFAEALVRSQQESRGLSRRGLRHELRKKGVDPETAEGALAAVDTESERARAEELVAGRLRRLHGLPREVQMRRLAGFLARKGYPGDLAFAVIREALDNAEEHARD
ncbi:regulatory protein RecX [Mobilicoccus pelagius]|uniref:Regulatory protein RecX n=1 Tax=Mobilicoccus pelagius NBRC 104925 TaxID=1089455 RepID=H5UNT0_9MICO|nr:regulatory protein RecX [Mobilicoccus pelagius]GAB47388.1 regulatory protein RecX [Mobilicoccus pelagius NBRC 104925]